MNTKAPALLLLGACSTLDIPPEANIADGDTGVAPVAVLELPLDPETTPPSAVTDDSMTLTNEDGFELPVTVVLDEPNMTAELTPIRPMASGTTYTLESPLNGIDGEPIALSFTTLENPIFRQFTFVPGTVNPVDYSEVDEEGRDLFFVDPGPDLVWPSADDVLGGYTEKQDRVGDTQLIVSFGAGPDGEFFTVDDTPTSYRETTFEGPLAVGQKSFTVGADGEIGTSDDDLSQIRENSFNENGQITRITISFDGGDNEPGSADDFVVFVGVSIYDERGLLQRFVKAEAGPDGELGTADDVVPDGPPTRIYDERGVYLGSRSESERSTNFVDSRGIAYREDFFDPGRDGALGTGDDRINFRFVYRVPE